VIFYVEAFLIAPLKKMLKILIWDLKIAERGGWRRKAFQAVCES